MKRINITMFLRPDEIQRAADIYVDSRPGTFAGRCAKEIIEPVLDRINNELGQDNDVYFLAYMVEYTFMVAGLERDKHEIDGL
jgi:hypothetical protein